MDQLLDDIKATISTTTLTSLTETKVKWFRTLAKIKNLKDAKEHILETEALLRSVENKLVTGLDKFYQISYLTDFLNSVTLELFDDFKFNLWLNVKTPELIDLMKETQLRLLTNRDIVYSRPIHLKDIKDELLRKIPYLVVTKLNENKLKELIQFGKILCFRSDLSELKALIDNINVFNLRKVWFSECIDYENVSHVNYVLMLADRNDLVEGLKELHNQLEKFNTF